MSGLVAVVKSRWGWTGIAPAAVSAPNRFGHVIVRDPAGAYWHLDPELATLDKVADDGAMLAAFWADPEVEELWRAETLVAAAHALLGEAGDDRCYGWKLPILLGGGFEAANMCILPIAEVIGFSGDLARQTRDIPAGVEVRLQIVP